jgi:hypothetical protein
VVRTVRQTAHTQVNRQQSVSHLRALVDSGEPEETLQAHLEAHPWMVAGIHPLDPYLVISKPPLGADYHPDFAFFWHHSGGLFIEMLEIERPSIEVFTSADEFTAEFNHAVQQLSDWEDWCNRHGDGVSDLLEPLVHMGLTTGLPRFSRVRTRLIAGRRAAASLHPRRKRRWQSRVAEVPSREIRTWDGFLSSFPDVLLADNPSQRRITCVRYRQQRYEVLARSGD